MLSAFVVGTTRRVFGPVRVTELSLAVGSGGYAFAEVMVFASLGIGSLLETGNTLAGDGLAAALAMPASLREAMLAKFSGSWAAFVVFAAFSFVFFEAGVFFGVGTEGTAGEPVRFSLAIAEPSEGNISSSNVDLFCSTVFEAFSGVAVPERVVSATTALALRGVC